MTSDPTLAAPAVAPSSDERVLAAIAHLGLFGGLWLVAPLAIYFYKRGSSRFVAFHAIQACILNVLAIPLSLLGFLLVVVLGVILTAALGSESDGLFATVGPVSLVGVIALPNVLLLVVALTAAKRALRGDAWSIPLVGRWAKSALDERAVRAP